MLSFTTPTVYEASKCFFTYGTMTHPDPKQPPSKGKPWNTLLGQGFVHKVDLIIPQDSWPAVRDRLVESEKAPEYYRVTMTLSQLLEGDFFTEYIKIGNVILLSEGRTNANNVFSLKDGKLTMYLEKETYERAGLVGKPHGVKGGRGLKPRWIVEFDLRSPSMFKGKKGFDRLVYACKNVLNDPVNWLFCNLSTKTPDPNPILALGATKHVLQPQIENETQLVVPDLKPATDFLKDGSRSDFEDFATEIYEWISLVRLRSPRVTSMDKVDPFLSRYRVPRDPEQHQEQALCKISWYGLISPGWTRKALIDVVLSLPSRSWFSLSASEFSKGFVGDSAERTMLRPPNSPGEYLLWEIKGHE